MKYIIEIKGEAKYRGCPKKYVNELSGISCEDEFSEYFDNDSTYFNDVFGGFMRFEAVNGILYVITEYDAERELNTLELEQLKDYTQGQWSDGIGEGFEQTACEEINGKDIFISPWFPGQIVEAIQYEN